MSLILKQLFNFIKLLNSDTGTNQIAAGIAAGWILGLSPLLSLQALLLFALFFFFRIQMGAAFLTAFFVKFIAHFFDPVFDSVGTAILNSTAFYDLFTSLYNMPIVPMTRFNNSIVMGSGVVGFLLSPLVFILARITVLKYREQILAKFQQTKIWKLVQATAFYKWYAKYNQLYN